MDLNHELDPSRLRCKVARDSVSDHLVADSGQVKTRHPDVLKTREPKFDDSADAVDVLNGAVSDGTSNMNWQQETFAYAEAHDGDTWVGVTTNQMVMPTPGGWLIHPDHVPAPMPQTPDDAVRAPDGGLAGDGTGIGDGGSSKESDVPSGSTVNSFYALFDLDRLRGAAQLADILEHVAAVSARTSRFRSSSEPRTPAAMMMRLSES